MGSETESLSLSLYRIGGADVYYYCFFFSVKQCVSSTRKDITATNDMSETTKYHSSAKRRRIFANFP